MGVKEKISRIPLREVDLDGERIYVRRLSGSHLARLSGFDQSKQDEAIRAMAYVAGACLCDEDGQRIFSDPDAAEIADIDSTYLRVICDSALDHSGLTDDAQAALKKSSTTMTSSNGGAFSLSPSESPALTDSSDESPPGTSAFGEPSTSETLGGATGGEPLS